MNTAHKSMHEQPAEQAAHAGQAVHAGHEHAHGHGHGHAHLTPSAYDQDEGIKMMRRLAMLQGHGLLGSWMTNYRNTRFIPVSNTVFAAAVAVLLVGVALAYFLPQNLRVIGMVIAGAAALYLAAISVIGFVVMRWLRAARYETRRTVIESIPMRGDEQVLDVACGSGILLNGFAQRLTTGKAVGIDIYQPNGGGGSLEDLRRNAKAEGVEGKISYQEMDARHLQFEDARFDVVASSLALHHIGTTQQEIEQAVIEMARVLKPGGYLSLVDLAPMIDIADGALQRAGLTLTKRTRSKYFKFITVQKL